MTLHPFCSLPFLRVLPFDRGGAGSENEAEANAGLGWGDTDSTAQRRMAQSKGARFEELRGGSPSSTGSQATCRITANNAGDVTLMGKFRSTGLKPGENMKSDEFSTWDNAGNGPNVVRCVYDDNLV